MKKTLGKILATTLLGTTLLLMTPRISNAVEKLEKPKFELVGKLVGGYGFLQNNLFAGLGVEIPIFKPINLTGGVRVGKTLRQHSKTIDVSVYPEKGYGGGYVRYSGDVNYKEHHIGLEAGLKSKVAGNFYVGATGGVEWRSGNAYSDEITQQYHYLDGTLVGEPVKYSMKSKIDEIRLTYEGSLTWQKGKLCFGIGVNCGASPEYSLNPEKLEHKDKVFDENYDINVKAGYRF